MKVFFCIIGIGIFTIVKSQVNEQTAVEGISSNINIRCNFGRQEAAPLWKINGTLYELTSLPSYIIVDSFSLITIPTITIGLNNTTYQCVSYDENRPSNLLLGTINKLTVVPGSNTQLYDANANKLELNYQQLEIGPVNTTIGWISSLSNCDTERLFKLQGFAESDVTSGHFAAPEISYNTTSDNITIPSSDLTGSNGEALYFRIIAIDDNNTICSSQESIRTFYQFNESQTLQPGLLVPNSSLCYTVPETVMNSPAVMVWPGRNGSDCRCIPQVELFELCSCESDYMVNISSNGSACFYNLSPAMNGTLVHFRRHTDICSSLPDCSIITILSSYEIIIGDGITQFLETKLQLYYQQLDIGPVNTTIGWIYLLPNCGTEIFFKLQGFTEPCGGDLTAPEINYTTPFNNITIPSSDLTGSTGEALYFRIIATNINNTICSSEKSTTTFYLFNESQTLQTDSLAPNTSKCYSVPETVMDKSADMILPDRDDCDCSIILNELLFECCSCKYKVNLSSNGSLVCFYNLTPAMNGTLVHFRRGPSFACPPDEVPSKTIILSSHRIIILGCQEDCSCYQNIDQINVTTIEVSETTVTITLSCGKDDDGIESFILQPQQIDITLMCSGNISIPSLEPGMEYSIVKMYYNQTNCTLATFNTSSPTITTSMPTSGQGSEVIKIILPIVIPALAFTFIAFIVCIIIIIIWRQIQERNGGNTPGDQLEGRIGDNPPGNEDSTTL